MDVTISAFSFQCWACAWHGCLIRQLCSPQALGIDQLLAPAEGYPGTLFENLCLSLIPSVHSSKYISTLQTLNAYISNCADVLKRPRTTVFGLGDHPTVGEAGHGHSTGHARSRSHIDQRPSEFQFLFG